MFTFKRSLLATLTILIMLLAAESRPALAYTEGIKVGKERERALYHVNYIRKQVGIRPSSHSSILARSAAAHSKYTVEADEFGHYETRTGSPYYVGYRPADRVARFNYPDPSTVTENIYTTWSAGTRGVRTYYHVDNAIQWWMAAIYHRFPIISPRTAVLGYGGYYKDGRSVSTLEFGNNYGLTGKMVRWPTPYQKGIGVRLEGEFPSPVEQFGGSFPTGYPVSITWHTGAVKMSSMTMVRAKGNANVPAYKLTPQNDEPEPGMTFSKWSTSLTLIPKKPLSYGTTYKVAFKGTYAANGDLSTGKWFSYTWSFTTMPSPPGTPTFSPAPGASSVSRRPTLQMWFNQPLKTYTLAHTSNRALNVGGIGVSLRNQNTGAEVKIDITRPKTSTVRKVTVRPGIRLTPNSSYRLSYRLSDAWGRLVAGSTYFTTAGR